MPDEYYIQENGNDDTHGHDHNADCHILQPQPLDRAGRDRKAQGTVLSLIGKGKRIIV